jgi:hypothetical protein
MMSEYRPLRRRFLRFSCEAEGRGIGVLSVEAAIVMCLRVRGEMMIYSKGPSYEKAEVNMIYKLSWKRHF